MKGAFRKVESFDVQLAGRMLLRPSLDASGQALLPTVAPADFLQAIGQVTAPGTPPPPTYGLTVLLWRNGGWDQSPPLDVAVGLPHVQALPDHEFLVVGTFSRRGEGGCAEPNASIYGINGALRSRFLAGDGIEDVQTDPNGGVWISYFDQGVSGAYGAHGWGRLSPETWIEPVGFAGLACFDSSGNRVFQFSSPAGCYVVNDCYALNVWEDSVWISYHPGFPVVRIRARVARGWATGIPGPFDALAADGDRLLLHSHSGSRRRCWLGCLDAGALVDLVEVELRLPAGGDESKPRWVLGRGPCLHTFTSTTWYRLAVSDIA